MRGDDASPVGNEVADQGYGGHSRCCDHRSETELQLRDRVRQQIASRIA